MKFVIGDIHGEITKLHRLILRLTKIGVERLVFVGDYIDKGEDSKATLEFLQVLSRKYRCDFLLGNHEYAWLRFIKSGEYRDFLLKYGGQETMRDFRMLDLTPQAAKKALYLPHRELFGGLKKFLVIGNYFISHSGINSEFIDVKNWDELDEREFVFQRSKVIDYKELVKGKKQIFGHTAFTRPLYDGYKIGIDTGAALAKKNPLTAFAMEERYFINHLGDKLFLGDIDITLHPGII